MIEHVARGGGRFEELASYVRARRVGDLVVVAGTTAVESSGRLHAPGDTYAQTHYALSRIERALDEVGATLADVIRTRTYLADIAAAADFARAHGEVFAGIEPVATAVQAGLSTPGMMVEIEVDAVIRNHDAGSD